MKISKKGIELIKKYEGLRLTAYKCPSGIWTIGYGHTKDVTKGMHITGKQSEELLKEDLKVFEDAVNNYVKVPLNQNQFDALVSFSFNCGSSALKRSTLLRKLNARDFSGAANEFLKWNKSNGIILDGLVKRRKDERALFLKSTSVYLSNKGYKGKSIVDALNQINVDSSYESRKRIAKANNIECYLGTHEQNIRLLNLLKNGKLIKD